MSTRPDHTPPHHEAAPAPSTTISASTEGNAGGNGGTPRQAKRRRIATACTPCRYRKSRCDGYRPVCTTCKDHGSECTYPPQSGPLNSVASRGHLLSVEERLTTVEQLLRKLGGRVDRIERDDRLGTRGPDPERVPEREIPDCFVEEDDSRTGADFQDATDGIGSIIFSQEEDAGYFGPSSNIAFTRHIVRATTTVLKRTQALSLASPDVAVSHNHMLHASRPPSPLRVPRGGSKNNGNPQSIFSLPAADETLRLINEFFSNTGMLFPYIHRETFLATYHDLTTTDFRKVRRSWLGLLNMVLAMATSASDSSHLTGQQRADESEVFFLRALALCEKQIRFQFLLLMSQYLQGTERSIQTWNVHGLAVKAAYQLGLHSRDALSQYPPLEREIRTRTWYGCVVLDRSLSMTLGRPSAIPESYVKLDMPRCLSFISSANFDTDVPGGDVSGDDSLAFYNSTIDLYKIMWTVLDSLYGGNLGCDSPQNVFDIASHLLRIEQKFLQWQMSLPPSVTLVQPADMAVQSGQENPEISRFRVILTLRYLNLRVLAHRPVLHRFLEAVGDHASQPVHTSSLRQVGSNSLRTCIQSAVHIVELMAHIIRSGDSQRHLGAWWFSLYYTFNAALVIYSGLLIRHDAESRSMPFPEGDIQVQRAQLQQAIESLLLLDRGNRMTEKCAKYISALASRLDSLFYSTSPQFAGAGEPQDKTRHSGPGDGQATTELLSVLAQSQTTPGVMDMSEFMDLTDLDFLNMPLHVHGHLRDNEWVPPDA